MHYSGAIARYEIAFTLQKNTFKISNDCFSSRKLLKGSRKTPARNYYKNPALQPIVTPLLHKENLKAKSLGEKNEELIECIDLLEKQKSDLEVKEGKKHDASADDSGIQHYKNSDENFGQQQTIPPHINNLSDEEAEILETVKIVSDGTKLQMERWDDES